MLVKITNIKTNETDYMEADSYDRYNVIKKSGQGTMVSTFNEDFTIEEVKEEEKNGMGN